MAVKRNAMEYAGDYSLAAHVVNESFYVDDCLTWNKPCNSEFKSRNFSSEDSFLSGS